MIIQFNEDRKVRMKSKSTEELVAIMSSGSLSSAAAAHELMCRDWF